MQCRQLEARLTEVSSRSAVVSSRAERTGRLGTKYANQLTNDSDLDEAEHQRKYHAAIDSLNTAMDLELESVSLLTNKMKLEQELGHAQDAARSAAQQYISAYSQALLTEEKASVNAHFIERVLFKLKDVAVKQAGTAAGQSGL